MERTESELRELRADIAENNGSDCAFSVFDNEHNEVIFGLSKREYFAGLALQSVIANGGYSELEIPICAVNFSDALLLALEG